MKRLLGFLFVVFSGCSNNNNSQAISTYKFLSFGGADLRQSKENSSGISIKNTSGSSVTINSFYLTALDSGSSYPTCFGSIVAGLNLMGAMWSPLEVAANEEIIIDKNYLYNLMLNYLYHVTQVAGSSPSTLPGGSAPGDVLNSWCIHIGLSSSNIKPQGNADTSPLIQDLFAGDPNEVALITCDDSTFSCTSSTENVQIFPR